MSLSDAPEITLRGSDVTNSTTLLTILRGEIHTRGPFLVDMCGALLEDRVEELAESFIWDRGFFVTEDALLHFLCRVPEAETVGQGHGRRQRRVEDQAIRVEDDCLGVCLWVLQGRDAVRATFRFSMNELEGWSFSKHLKRRSLHL